jgi:enhancing lycopene biosynthesis protein 2
VSTPKKIAVVLSGCGNRDGSEITEAVSVLIALSELGAEAVCFAPDQEFEPSHYVGGIPTSASKRNALEESGRIARGSISPLAQLNEKDFDAIVFPGGMGASKTLSSWATAGAKTSIQTEVKKAIVAFHRASKPIGAICIAPVLVARVLGAEHPEVTIGDDAETASEIEKTGARHTKCVVTDYVSDRDHKLLTTPAYMYDKATPFEVFTGIRRMLTELVEMA